ncbi:MAG: hypothetical protein JSV09_06070 [Thermoplasmata archaeon]|nr:MAG: hypothetical protein JSV09_06070 [Thermoplasmata archaeon]
MERKKFSIISVLVVGIMFAAVLMPISFVGFVVAPVGQQVNLWWDAEVGPNVGSTNPAQNREITAWIDGVSYGSNTTDAQGKFDLYIDGDTWSLDDDWVKSGGFDGDLTQYFLDYDPMTSYNFIISDHTTDFIFGKYENVTLFFDDETFQDPNYMGPGGTYLRGLKIDEIVLQPNDGVPNQYLMILDPLNQLTEAMVEDATHGYYIQKDDPTGHTPNGPIFHFSDDPSKVVKVGAYFYINLTSNWLDVSADEIKLVWKNPTNHGGTPTADNIANGTDVIVDRVEWGNHINLNDSDYDNTTMVDVTDLPPLGESLIRIAPGSDTDDCFVDFTINPTPTVRPAVVEDVGTPGAPTDLWVHKGGGAWGGTADDLVLNWTAPSVNWDNLELNIVYYDMDITDGFQYSNFIYFEPNSTTSGGPDWCILPGWLTDANKYFFIVRTTNDSSSQEGGLYENMTGTNIGYKSWIQLLKNPDPQTSQLVVSLPYFCDWTKASDIVGPGKEFTNSNIIAIISKWNYATQKFSSLSYNPISGQWVGTDFDINQGDAIVLGVTASSPFQWNIVGSYDETFEFELLKNPDPLTSQMGISLPYHKSYMKLSDVPGTDFTDNTRVSIISQWNYTIQKFDSLSYNPISGQWVGKDAMLFASPGDHLFLGVTASTPYYWKPDVITL